MLVNLDVAGKVHSQRFPALRVPGDESGKRRTNRLQLAAALDTRNVHFISALMESGVDFVAVDMPQANRLTIHILAAVAEHEREAIAQRTKAALGAAK